ncbi:MAG: hypothetical protein CL609_12555 [Anaerolineaceae bacterium]|nr:hypothetical protein [Anaerolineaceae bacterium]
MQKIKKIVLLMLIIILSGCGSPKLESEVFSPPSISITETPLPVVKQIEPVLKSLPTQIKTEISPVKLWINPLIFDRVKEYLVLPPNLDIVNQVDLADYRLDKSDFKSEEGSSFSEYFVLSVPFVSLVDNISFNDLKAFWNSTESDTYQLWINPADFPVMQVIMGTLNNPNVHISNEIPDGCNSDIQCVRIHRFEESSPLWRVVSVNNLSIFDRYADFDQYPLRINYLIQESNNIKTRVQEDYIWWTRSSNFYPDQLTVLMLTGTSALTRGTAFQMEKNGVDFPLKNIAEILHQADILHVSHEVPMFEDCPPAVPLREEMRFCSDPKNVDLFKMLGVDIIELTGNHLLDWGPEAFLETLSLYDRQGLLVYGAGVNPETASSGLEITDHGNRFVFLGCNISGPDNVWVSDERPGVQKCDQDFLNGQITSYKQQGFLPIVTYQHYELDGFTPNPQLQADFWQSAKAGAVIVSGSQAHFPQGFDFVNGSFIDYGVGNLFFDQMQTWYRKATIDIHYFYNGSYINTALIPIINENQGQPRLMTDEESERFLSKLYENSFYEKN